MTSPPLDSTHGRTMSGVACHHRLWVAHTVKRRRAWHDIIALGQHTRSDYIGRGVRSPSLDSTHGRTTLGVACHHRLWVAHTDKRRRAWHAIIALGRQIQSNDVRRDMPSPPLDNTHGKHCQVWLYITALGLHAQSDDVMRGMTSPPLESTHGRTTSGVACHHRVWEAYTVK